jgi:hypothetical protein
MPNEITPDMTAEAAAAIEAAAAARAKALEAQVKELAARKALAEATASPAPPSPPDNAERAKKLADQERSRWEAAKAAAEARSAAATAAVPKLPDAPSSGKITLGEGAGLAESTMLSMAAVRALAGTVAERLQGLPVAKGQARCYILAPLNAVPDLQRWATFTVRCTLLRERLDALAAEDTGATRADFTAATITAGLAMVGTALSWLKPDYDFKGLAIDSNDSMLIVALADKLLAQGAQVHLPTLQASRPQLADPPALSQLKLPFAMLDEVSGWVARATPLAARWTALQAEIKAWCDSLVAADVAGTVPLHQLVRDAQIVGMLGPDTFTVGLMLHKVVGSAFSKKGGVAGLAGPELLVSGAATASYVAYAADSGQLLSAGLLSHHGGRRKILDTGSEQNAG